jgi:hypothetical protein
MVKPQIKTKNRAWLSAVFLIIGIGLIYYALTAPCQVDSIKTIAESGNVQGIELPDQEITMEFPWQIEKAMCISTDFMTLISILIGATFVTTGASTLVRKLVN